MSFPYKDITGPSLAVLPFEIAIGTRVVHEALNVYSRSTENRIKAATYVVCEYYKVFRTKPADIDYEDFLCGSKRRGIQPHQLWRSQVEAHMNQKWRMENPAEGYSFIYSGVKFKNLEDFLAKSGQTPLCKAAKTL